MQNKRWLRPLLAFTITFGVLAMAGAMVRVFVVYQRLFSLGMTPDDPAVATRATEELSHMDRLYTPIFLIVVISVSAAFAVIFALWRPKAKVDLPPPLSADR